MALTVTALAAKPQPPAALIKVRQAFAAAVAAKDESGASKLTHFPLRNSVYKERQTLGRSSFATRFAEYTNMTDCIKTAPLVLESAGWTIDCDGNLLRFEMRGGRWVHTAYENVNE